MATVRGRPEITWPKVWGIALPVVFILASAMLLAPYIRAPGALGYDGRMYSLAARALLEGANPWTVELAGGSFAGPPTSLIPYLPVAYLPQEITAGIWIAGDLVLAIVMLRRLRMPAWWLAFPPLFVVIISGGVEIPMVALLLLGGRIAGLSAVLKPYAALPLLAERRWDQLALGAAVGLGTFLVLPWGLFIESLPRITERLAAQSSVENAFGSPLLMAAAIVALISLGKAGIWLTTPALWPSPQGYYGLMCLPVLTPMIALCWALPIPQAALVGITAQAFVGRVRPTLPTQVAAARSFAR